MNRRPIIVAIAAVMFAAAATTAMAQRITISPPIDALPSDDLNLILSAEDALYAAAAPEVGTTEVWENPANGDQGTAVLTEIYEWRGLPCRKIEHRVLVAGHSDYRGVAIDRCRIATGEWKIRY
ncbi:MAG: hypothetical protein GY791_11090 [Alphaproteobacteria bacterium]|nr:hypothetical protein [Alphaproteobacteria bacterium]